MSPSGVAWPEGARTAVLITVNFDAELFWLRLDPSVIERPKTRSIGEYGGRRGASRVLDVLRASDVRSTWFVSSDIVPQYRRVLERVVEEGHCVASRGPGLVDFFHAPSDVQRLALESSSAVLEELVGAPPDGFRPPGEVSDEIATLLAETGYRWASITRGDDRPLYLVPVNAERLPIVDVTRSWDLDDTSRFLFNYGPAYPKGQSRIAAYAQVLADWKAEFDAIYELGLSFTLSLEPQAIGTPGRIGLLEELLAHISERPGVWFATGAMMEQWWRRHGTADGTEPEAIRRAARASLQTFEQP